ESIAYESDAVELTITMKKDELGRYAWVSAVPRKSDAQESELDPADPHAPPPDDGEPEEFKAGPAGDTIVEGLAPFMAKRTLEGIGADKLADLGLEDPEATLTIARHGREP